MDSWNIKGYQMRKNKIQINRNWDQKVEGVVGRQMGESSDQVAFVKTLAFTVWEMRKLQSFEKWSDKI